MTFHQTTRFNHARILSEDEIRRYAPSVFAVEAHASRSERFAPIPTIEIVRGLSQHGWDVVKAGQSVTRDPSKANFTKHMLRFRKNDRTDLAVDDNLMELVLVNGNDGSAAYNLEAGVFRIACLNGMIVKSKDFGGVKIRHTGDAFSKVIEGSYEVLEHAQKVLEAPKNWGKIQLSDDHRMAFAVGAHAERFEEGSGTAIKPEQLLIPRRTGDMGRDLWSTFNVLQENVIRGGLEGTTVLENGRRRRSQTREIRGIDQNVRVNKGLWQMAEWLANRVG